VPISEWEAIVTELRRTCDPETVQELLIILFKYQPDDPIHYARRCLRTIRGQQRQEATRPICPVEDDLVDNGPDPLRLAIARQALERVPTPLVLDQLGVAPLKRHVRQRLRRKARAQVSAQSE
jgi:hypothetical protein